MVDATDTPDEVEPEVNPDPNADLRAEIDAKRQEIADIENGHAANVADQQAELDRKLLQAESDRLDRELATAQMLADHQSNARGPLSADGEAEDDGGTLSSRRRRKRNTSATDTTETGASA